MNGEVSTMDSGAELLADAQDEAKRQYLAMCQDWSLADHDRRFHPDGYREGDACKVREKLAKADDPDREVSAAKAEKAEKVESKDVLGDVAKLAKELGAANDRDGKAKERLFRSIKEIPWSSFGQEDGVSQEKKLAEFERSLPQGWNLDGLLQREVEVGEEAGNLWEPKDVLELFCDAREDGDRTLGDTLEHATGHIAGSLEDLAKEQSGDAAAAEEDYRNSLAERDALRHNAPFSAWANGD